jgi:hypothetical protein
VKKVHISVTFLLKAFFGAFFKTFKADSKSAWNSVFFDSHIEFLKKLLLLALFVNFDCKCGGNGSKKRNNLFFINVSYNFIRQPSKGLHNQVVKIVVPFSPCP